MKEAEATTGNDVLKGGAGTKAEAGAEAGAGAGPQKKKVTFAGDVKVSGDNSLEIKGKILASAAESTIGRGVISTVSGALGLEPKKMQSIVSEYATKGNISEENQKYLNDQYDTNSKFQNAINSFSQESGKPLVDMAQSLSPSQMSEEDERKKRGQGSIGKAGDDSQNKGLDTKTKLLIGLCIGCILLATGGIPLIAGLFGLSQGTLIAGAVLTGLGAAGAIASGYGAFKSSRESGKISPEMQQNNAIQNQGAGGDSTNPLEGLMKMIAKEIKQGGNSDIEKREEILRNHKSYLDKILKITPEEVRGNLARQAGSLKDTQTEKNRSSEVPAPAPLSDLMQLTKKDKDLGIQIAKDKMTAMSQELEKNSNLSKILNNTTDSKTHKAESGEVMEKLLQNAPKDIERDSKSQSQLFKALNLETPQTNRSNPSSQSWAQRMVEAKGSRGTSGARDV